MRCELSSSTAAEDNDLGEDGLCEASTRSDFCGLSSACAGNSDSLLMFKYLEMFVVLLGTCLLYTSRCV